MEKSFFSYEDELLEKGRVSGYADAHKAIDKILKYPQQFADIIKNELYGLLKNANLRMKLSENTYYLNRWSPELEIYAYWFAYSTELEEYLNEYDRLDNLLKGIKPQKKDEVATSLAVYFKNASAADYMRHRQAIELFLKRARRDKKHRIMSLWHYLKQHQIIIDKSETPYGFTAAIQKEFYDGTINGSAYQGLYKQELNDEYEILLKGL